MRKNWSKWLGNHFIKKLTCMYLQYFWKIRIVELAEWLIRLTFQQKKMKLLNRNNGAYKQIKIISDVKLWYTLWKIVSLNVWGLKGHYTFKHVWRSLCPAHKFQAELENLQTYLSNMFEEKAPHYTIKSVCQTNISNKHEEANKLNTDP